MLKNEDNFLHSSKIYEVKFADIIRCIFAAYGLLMGDNVQLKNNENYIRDILVERYLNAKREQLRIEHVIFNCETAENMAKGYVDIKVQTMISLNNPEAYYIFECKRLDGNRTLNNKYIAEGIIRFTTEKYSSYHGINAMIGFEVKSFDTLANIEAINRLAFNKYPEANILKKISPTTFAGNFKHICISSHDTASSMRIELYHLMLDFSAVVIM